MWETDWMFKNTSKNGAATQGRTVLAGLANVDFAIFSGLTLLGCVALLCDTVIGE